MTRSTKLKIIIKDNVRLGISCAPPKKEDPPSFIWWGSIIRAVIDKHMMIIESLFLKEKLIIDNISINENKMFSLINNFILHNKYLIISSRVPITSLKINLKDLKSRLRQFYLLEIKNPSDNLVYSLIMKFFSDNQIVIRKELIENIVKKIDRSYLRIDDFLTKLNKQSIIKKRKIDYKLINEVFDSMAWNCLR